MKLWVFLCFFPVLAAAQTAGRITWGMFVGGELQSLSGIELSKPKEPYLYLGKPTAGYSGGLFGAYRLRPAISLRAQASLARNVQEIHYYADEDNQYSLKYTFTDLEVPLHLVITNPKTNLPLRSSFLIGGRFSYSVSSLDQDFGIDLFPQRLAVDLGLGLEISKKQWRIKPEVTYSRGVNNLHNFGESAFDWKIGRIERDRISLRVFIWKEDQ